MFLGRLVLIPGHSHSMSAWRCTGSFCEALEVLTLVPGSVSACDKRSSSLGEGGLLRGLSQPAQLSHRRVSSMQRKGRPPGQSLSNDRGVSGMAA